jgi:iron donor protein CyaY
MSERISEAEFQQKAEAAIEQLERAYIGLADKRDIDVQLAGGVLTITFEEGEPGRFIVSPNSAARQVWVSARVASHKFDWSSDAGCFVNASSGESLDSTLRRLTAEQLGDSDFSL